MSSSVFASIAPWFTAPRSDFHQRGFRERRRAGFRGDLSGIRKQLRPPQPRCHRASSPASRRGLPHRDRTSTNEDFVSAVEPVFAVISVGFENSYGLPNRDVIERLRQHRAVVYRTEIGLPPTRIS